MFILNFFTFEAKWKQKLIFHWYSKTQRLNEAEVIVQFEFKSYQKKRYVMGYFLLNEQRRPSEISYLSMFYTNIQKVLCNVRAAQLKKNPSKCFVDFFWKDFKLVLEQFWKYCQKIHVQGYLVSNLWADIFISFLFMKDFQNFWKVTLYWH